MSDESIQELRIGPDNPLSQAWKIAAAVGALGVGISVMGAIYDPHRFAFSYLYGFVLVMTMVLGSILFVLLQHLSHAGWSVTVRRAAEFFAAGALVIPILFIPVVLNADKLYPWWEHDEGVAHAQDEGAEQAEDAAADPYHGHTPEHFIHAKILDSKRWYLNQPFWFARMALCFLAWIWLSTRLFGYSTAQDKSKDPQYTVKLQRMSTYGLLIWAFTLTIGAIDWIMGLEPNWYSTMFGVKIFASSAVISYALIILLTLWFKKAGVVGEQINVEHFHDLGKLMFGFLIFWAYISFSEFFLIWYASIPEETIHFHRVWDHPDWKLICLTIVTMKFIVPFYFIMSRNVKRNLSMLAFGAFWLLAVHLIELFYWIMPYASDMQDVAWNGLWIDFGCALACVGIYLAVVFGRMLNHNVIPVGDPRLARALSHVNH